MTTIDSGHGWTETAACLICDADATHGWVAGKADRGEETSFNAWRIARRFRVVAYGCADHSEQVLNDLVEEYGGASNMYETDLLAKAVTDGARKPD